jgi:hypothetical protein
MSTSLSPTERCASVAGKRLQEASNISRMRCAAAFLAAIPIIVPSRGSLSAARAHCSATRVAVGATRAGGADNSPRPLPSNVLDLAYDQTEFRAEVIEASLAHGEVDHVKAAYNRGDFQASRKALLQAWNDFLDPDRASNVIRLGSSERAPAPSGVSVIARHTAPLPPHPGRHGAHLLQPGVDLPEGVGWHVSGAYSLRQDERLA